MNSDFDKYMSFLQKSDSALFLQNEVACQSGMELIDMLYGPFDEDEIHFYLHRLSNGGSAIINPFQKELVFNLYYKYFGSPVTLNSINMIDYVKLIIASKRILEAAGMVLMPYIISSRIDRLATRKTINKKELTKLELSPLYQQVKDKYRNEKVEKQILSIIATILSSDFEAIEMDDSDIDGTRISVIPELILEEIPMYIALI